VKNLAALIVLAFLCGPAPAENPFRVRQATSFTVTRNDPPAARPRQEVRWYRWDPAARVWRQTEAPVTPGAGVGTGGGMVVRPPAFSRPLMLARGGSGGC
jgi:hypothetical protein